MRALFAGLLSATFAVTSAIAADPVKVEMVTSAGTIHLELDPEKAPITVQNFVDYAESGFYDGTIFHRVIDGFMIQGGGFDTNFREKRNELRPPIKNEAANGLKNENYTVAMARTNDPHSATSQFFVNAADNAFLNRSGQSAGYAVFGRVTEGKEVVDKIAKVKTASRGGHQDVPVENVVIQKVTIKK